MSAKGLSDPRRSRYRYRLLVKAFGETGAKNMQSQMVRTDELNSGRAESLQRADPKQLAALTRG